MSKNELYTVFVTCDQSVKTTSGADHRRMMFVYYDVMWKQIGFYSKKHGAQHVTVELQSSRLNRGFETHTLDDITWSEEALRNSLSREPRIDREAIGGVAPRASKKPVAPPTRVGERVRIDTGYGDLVNAMVKEA
jgi:hypothetical protein